jgi:hypothetical protein
VFPSILGTSLQTCHLRLAISGRRFRSAILRFGDSPINFFLEEKACPLYESLAFKVIQNFQQDFDPDLNNGT